MSRLARKPIPIISGVTANEGAGQLVFKGALGEKKIKILEGVSTQLGANEISLKALDTTKQTRANLGTMAALIKNAMMGTTSGFLKTLEIEGVGYRAIMEGKTLVLFLGFVNPVRFDPPVGVTIIVEKNIVKISGIDKEVVGQAAAQIRSFRKPEPYKGKGIRYQGEVIKIKVGKKAAAAA